MSNTSAQFFDAARVGDAETVRQCLKSGADVTAMNDFGFTALHCAAMGSNSASIERIVEVLSILIDADSPMEAIGGGGRTALYLAAEFSPSIEPIQLLVNAGANPNVADEHGNSIVENAMSNEVQRFLSSLTGTPLPKPSEPETPAVKMTAKQWRSAKNQLDGVFETLNDAGLITMHVVGTTQEDGFSDCCEELENRGGLESGIHGFCYYTRQDLNRAKRTSHLPLAFWGAPDGSGDNMERVGQLIVDTFRDAGLTIEWNGQSSTRPTVYFAEAGQMHAPQWRSMAVL